MVADPYDTVARLTGTDPRADHEAIGVEL